MREFGFGEQLPENDILSNEGVVGNESTEKDLVSFSDPVKDHLRKLKTGHPDLTDAEIRRLEDQLRESSKPFAENEKRLRGTLNRMAPRLRKFVGPVMLTAALNGVYGEANAGQVTIKIAEAMPSQDQKVLALNKTEDKLLSNLETEVGSDGVARLENLHSVQSAEERQTRLRSGRPKSIPMNGFEKYKIGTDTMRTIIERTLPRSFAYNFGEVNYEDTVEEAPAKYGLNNDRTSEKKYSAAHVSPDRNMTFSRLPYEMPPQYIIDSAITHESCHLQDWDFNQLLTLGERLRLLQSVVNRVHAEDRFKSDYVEGIKNDDPKFELEIKAREYFAEICAAYLGDKYLLLPNADRAIMIDMLAKTDPNYDRNLNQFTRDDIIKGLMVESGSAHKKETAKTQVGKQKTSSRSYQKIGKVNPEFQRAPKRASFEPPPPPGFRKGKSVPKPPPSWRDPRPSQPRRFSRR